MNWYFSDPHWGHKRMADLRDFSSTEEMNQAIIDGINSKCTNRDRLYCLGDVFWEGSNPEIKQFIKKLNFKKLIFIKGNHDKPLLRFLAQSKDSRLELHNDLIMKDSGYRLHLYHYPVDDFDGKYNGGYHLHGHQHKFQNEQHSEIKNAYNVNVDMNDYKPLCIEEIVAMCRKRTIKE